MSESEENHTAKRQKTTPPRLEPMATLPEPTATPTITHEPPTLSPRPPTLTPQPPTTPTMQPPEATVDICPDGDVILIVARLASIPTPAGIRVSSSALSISSPVFRRLLGQSQPSLATATLATPVSAQDKQPQPLNFPPATNSAPTSPVTPTPDSEPRLLYLPNADADSLYLLLNILHLRNDLLPTRLPPDALFRFISCAATYEALMSVSRAASVWLDYLHSRNFPGDDENDLLLKLVEAAYILNDAVWFARFSARWVLTQRCGMEVGDVVKEAPRQKLGLALLARQRIARLEFQADLDVIVEPLAEALSDDVKHYIDCAPGDSPTPSEPSYNNSTWCQIDKDGSTLYLSALRDANLWPSTKWPTTLSAVLERLSSFRVPEYDVSDACYWCINIDDQFANALNVVRKEHKAGRLWGLCLDCYKGNGTDLECRVEHKKGE